MLPFFKSPLPFKSLLLGALLSVMAGQQVLAAELAPLLVANQKSLLKVLLQVSGELKDVPYEIRFSEFPSAAPLGEALNAEAVDIGALGDAPYVFALGAGAPLKVVQHHPRRTVASPPLCWWRKTRRSRPWPTSRASVLSPGAAPFGPLIWRSARCSRPG